MEVRLGEFRPAEVRSVEDRPDEVRPDEVRCVQIRAAQFWPCARVFPPPFIPSFNALLQNLEVSGLAIA